MYNQLLLLVCGICGAVLPHHKLCSVHLVASSCTLTAAMRSSTGSLPFSRYRQLSVEPVALGSGSPSNFYPSVWGPLAVGAPRVLHPASLTPHFHEGYLCSPEQPALAVVSAPPPFFPRLNCPSQTLSLGFFPASFCQSVQLALLPLWSRCSFLASGPISQQLLPTTLCSFLFFPSGHLLGRLLFGLLSQAPPSFLLHGCMLCCSFLSLLSSRALPLSSQCAGSGCSRTSTPEPAIPVLPCLLWGTGEASIRMVKTPPGSLLPPQNLK